MQRREERGVSESLVVQRREEKNGVSVSLWLCREEKGRTWCQ